MDGRSSWERFLFGLEFISFFKFYDHSLCDLDLHKYQQLIYSFSIHIESLSETKWLMFYACTC